MKRSFHLLAAGCALAVLTACSSSDSASPTGPGALRATIKRTTFGIPHISAADFQGLGFGIAYAQAQDNLCLMADNYLSVSGERSRFLGADQSTQIGLWPATNLDSDFYYRTVQNLDALHAEHQRRSADYRDLTRGWVAGYNAYLKDHAGKLPAACADQPWVRPITEDDVLRSLNDFAMLLSSNSLSTAIATAAPPTAAAAMNAQRRANPVPVARSLPPIPAWRGFGSNGWAFGADATDNGAGLVMGNPHFPWLGPKRFYEMHLTIPGQLDVAGATLINQFYIGIGFNKDVAWTHTVDTATHMTLARLALDPADPTAYLVDGRREPMTRRTLTVEVRGGPPVTRTVYGSRFGPLISLPGTPYAWTTRQAYAVSDANNGNVRGGDTYLAMARARGVQDVRAALVQHRGAAFVNTLAADRSGAAIYADITPAPNLSATRYASCGTTSDRVPGQFHAFYILDGSRSECEWEKTATDGPLPHLLPASEMATVLRRDYVQNSNDSYRWTHPAVPLALGPMNGLDPGPTVDLRTRAGVKEIQRVLASGRFNPEIAAATMLGNRHHAAELTLPAVLALCQRPAAPAAACAALAKWDGKMELDSRGATLFARFWQRASVRPDLWTQPFDPAQPFTTPHTVGTGDALARSLLTDLSDAAAELQAAGIALDARLGDVQFAQRGAERIPVSGGNNGGVLNYMEGVPVPGGFSVIHGSSYLQAVTFDAQGPVALALLTYSQSTDPASPHFGDQTREFSAKRLRRFPFTEAEIAAEQIGAVLTVGP